MTVCPPYNPASFTDLSITRIIVIERQELLPRSDPPPPFITLDRRHIPPLHHVNEPQCVTDLVLGHHIEENIHADGVHKISIC